MCIITDGSETPIPEDAILLSDNHIAQVWKVGDWVWKRSIPFLIENEMWCLEKIGKYLYAPTARRLDKYTLKTHFIEIESVTDPKKFMQYLLYVLRVLRECGIRHGDLTKYSVLVQDNSPILIDFAESRLWDDPRPDKRPEGDEYWLTKTMKELAGL